MDFIKERGQLILIDDIAYISDVNEKVVKYYMDLYSGKCPKPIDPDRKPTVGPILIKNLKGKTPEDTLIEWGWEKLIPLLTGGNKYLIVDGRHRLVAKKRLGKDVIGCRIE